MRSPKMSLALVPSMSMTNRGEDSCVRMAKRSRDYISPIGKTIEITPTVGGETFRLRIKSAYRSDINSARESKISLETVGFVSKNLYDKLTGADSKGTAWVSESIDALKVGSDPEFGLIDDVGDFIYASNVCETGLDSNIGHDGPCMELRPEQSDAVDTHLSNIGSLIKSGCERKDINRFKWWTGATYKSENQERKYTLGGHIHIGNPSIMSDFLLSEKNRKSKRPMEESGIQRRILRVLDELVGIPLANIDSPDPAYRRKKSYGFPGDFRSQVGRFEWRTPSAVWLTNPDIARAVLGTSKAVSEECYRRLVDKNFSPNTIYHAQGTQGSLLNSFGCVSNDILIKILVSGTSVDPGVLGSVVKALRAMSTYGKYKEFIDEFIKLTVNGKPFSTDELYGMKKSWEKTT